MSINKQGVWKGNNFLNYAYRTIISPNIIQEPDGSVWLQVFHHNNPANNLFTSTDTFTIGVYKDENKWFNFNLCNICSKWEILVKQKPTSTGTEVKYRWIQTANPMTCAFADVDAKLLLLVIQLWGLHKEGFIKKFLLHIYVKITLKVVIDGVQ